MSNGDLLGGSVAFGCVIIVILLTCLAVMGVIFQALGIEAEKEWWPVLIVIPAIVIGVWIYIEKREEKRQERVEKERLRERLQESSERFQRMLNEMDSIKGKIVKSKQRILNRADARRIIERMFRPAYVEMRILVFVNAERIVQDITTEFVPEEKEFDSDSMEPVPDEEEYDVDPIEQIVVSALVYKYKYVVEGRNHLDDILRKPKYSTLLPTPTDSDVQNAAHLYLGLKKEGIKLIDSLVVSSQGTKSVFDTKRFKALIRDF
jgi:uncharacterized membrane protein (DUF106 family)